MRLPPSSTCRSPERDVCNCSRGLSRRCESRLALASLLLGLSCFLAPESLAWWPNRDSSEMPAIPPFRGNGSNFHPEDVKRMHASQCGEPPDVQLLNLGFQGLYAARSMVRIAAPARTIMEWLSTPDINLRIFAKHTVSHNYRKLLYEDRNGRIKVYESSKTGLWRVLGVRLYFESTVLALEDWKNLEIRYWLKRPGAMKHFSGVWKLVPSGKGETLIVFYHEAMPAKALAPVMRLFRPAVAEVCRRLAASLLEDLTDFAERYFVDGKLIS
eukprot:TRINITY_DN99112_c0_g1_i1.p1 TRINITY_DN99112_c0_g1~~TRINITY_DN99112_c0_g1_i1.p1  ORF type:complete len:271 (+),score=46.58 TRINITY_DN99112_c0_g1_i1:121-933(+)